MRRMRPGMHDVRMATEAVLVRHQAFGRNEATGRRRRKRRLEVLRSILRYAHLRLRPDRVGSDGEQRHGDSDSAPARADLPLDGASRQTVHDEEPRHDERRGDVQPVHRLADGWLAHPHHHAAEFNARQRDSGHKQHDRRGEGRDAGGDRPRVRPVRDVPPVQHAEHEVREEVPEIELPLDRLARSPLEEGDRRQVDAVHRQDGEQAEHGCKQPLQLRTNRGTVLRHGAKILDLRRSQSAKLRIYRPLDACASTSSARGPDRPSARSEAARSSRRPA